MKKIAEPAVLLEQGLRELGLDAALQAPLLAYLDELVKWNGAYNLTSVRDPADMVTRHLLDSLAVLPHASRLTPHGTRVVDIGAGAGLPGVVLALARPRWQVALLDSNGKKVRFLRHVQRTLGLEQVEVIESRCEDFAPAITFDAVISRAFASLRDFIDLTRHLLAPDGRWLAMKGRVDENEAAEIPNDIRIEEIVPLEVPGLAEQRHLIIASPRSKRLTPDSSP